MMNKKRKARVRIVRHAGTLALAIFLVSLAFVEDVSARKGKSDRLVGEKESVEESNSIQREEYKDDKAEDEKIEHDLIDVFSLNGNIANEKDYSINERKFHIKLVENEIEEGNVFVITPENSKEETTSPLKPDDSYVLSDESIIEILDSKNEGEVKIGMRAASKEIIEADEDSVNDENTETKDESHEELTYEKKEEVSANDRSSLFQELWLRFRRNVLGKET